MIRNALFAPAAGIFRAVARSISRALEAVAVLLPWRSARRLVQPISVVIEIFTEYALYVVGWICWALDWAFRLPALALYSGGRLSRGYLPVRGVLLLEKREDPDVAFVRARELLHDAAALLERYEITLVPRTFLIRPKPDFLRSAPCGVSGLFSRFFSWASSRADGSPALTIYFVERLDRVIGCAYPGADWIVVDARADGATIVHELGHLADLWRHTPDPKNVMTARNGGAQDGVTARQRAMIRTCRFVGRLGPPETVRPRFHLPPGPYVDS